MLALPEKNTTTGGRHNGRSNADVRRARAVPTELNVVIEDDVRED